MIKLSLSPKVVHRKILGKKKIYNTRFLGLIKK
jgi:hypothetical protein